MSKQDKRTIKKPRPVIKDLGTQKLYYAKPSLLIWLISFFRIKNNISKKKLQHDYDSSRGLWCIDKNPKDVSIEWIRENAFQL